MKKILFFWLIFCSISFTGLCQNMIDVAESTFKVGGLGSEEFYFGFAGGDQVIFNFQEMNGKELKEIEVIEYPSSSKYMEYKAIKVENKTINIASTGIYKFRFYNSAMGGRVCKYKIQRIPSSESLKNFNTSVYWQTFYDSTYIDKTRQVIDRIDTAIEKSTTVITVDASQKNHWTYQIPKNTKFWSYRIGVGQEGQEALKNDMKAVANILQSKGAKTVCKAFGGTGLEAYALGYITNLSIPKSGEDVDYGLLSDYENVQLYYSTPSLAKGIKWVSGVVVDFAKIETKKDGTIYFVLHNDNILQNIDVNIDCVAIIENTIYKTESYKELNIKTRKEPYLKN